MRNMDSSVKRDGDDFFQLAGGWSHMVRGLMEERKESRG